MKKIKYLLFMVFVTIFSCNVANAASLNVSASSRNVVVGNTVNVTVSINRAGGADGWEYCLKYDSGVFTYTGSKSLCVLGGELAGNSSVTFSFKAKASGTGTFSLGSVSVLDASANSVATTTGSVSVTAKTQAEIEASYSTNANLKSLSVEGYEISPSFNKDTLEYSLEVENEVDKIDINASKADGGASVRGAGEKELTEGVNKFEIVVTAEKGNKKTYVLNVTRKELDPINVSVDGKNFTVVRKAEVLEAPTYYSSTTINIGEDQVPAFTSEITGYKLVGLKDEDGNIKLYKYNEDNTYEVYKQIGTESFVFIVMNVEDLVDGYEKVKTVKINDIEVNGYYNDRTPENMVLVYGMNAANGNKAWYRYDTDEGTFQKFQNNEVIQLQDDLNDYFLLVIVFSVGLGLSILLIIMLVVMNSKTKKKNNKMIAMLENGHVVKDEVKKEEKEVEVSKEEIVEKEEPKKKRKTKKIVEEPIVEEVQEVPSVEEPTEDIIEETLSKRELKRREKEEKKKQLEELKKMQDDFFSDYQVVEEVEEKIEQTQEIKKSLNETLAEKKNEKRKK